MASTASIAAIVAGILLLLFAKKVLKAVGTLVLLAGLAGIYLVLSGQLALPMV